MHDLYVTIINKTHSSTHDAMDAALATVALGGAAIFNDARWSGKWTSLGRVHNGKFVLTVENTSAGVVRIDAAGHEISAQSHPIRLMMFTNHEECSQSAELDKN